MAKDIGIIKKIIENYTNIEESIVKQLNISVKHPGSIGGFREEIWKSLFEQIVPKKFSVERSVFIIDSNGNVSHEVDLVIFDEQYTPYIFRYGTLKFIPIEAVAVVIECKSTKASIKSDKIKIWSDSIDELQTSLNSIVRMATGIMVTKEDSEKELAQTSTRPIKILCCLEYPNDVKQYFDFIISANDTKLNVDINNEKNLRYWYLELNHTSTWREGNNSGEGIKSNNKSKIKDYCGDDRNLSDYEVKDSDNNKNTILTLIFQLNQLLMLINNPILFPHMSYVNLFNNPEVFFSEEDELKAKEISNEENIEQQY